MTKTLCRGRARRRLLMLPVLLAGLLALSVACATTRSGAGTSGHLKHRVAVLPIENTTDFVTGAFEGSYGVPLGEQARALLVAQLSESGQVVLVEARDESDGEPPKADYVLTGQLTEFGRRTRSSTQVLVDSKRQSAHAAVSLRLIEVRSGQVLFTSDGRAEARAEDAQLFGMGTEAPFNEALNGEALEAALSAPAAELLERLLEQPWRTVLVATEGDEIVIAGGEEQGLRVGDALSVRKRGQAVESPQLEGTIELPSTEVARIKIVSCFGSGTNREGSVCRLIEGGIEGYEFDALVVEQLR